MAKKKKLQAKPARKGRFTVKDLTWSMSVTFLIGYDSKQVARILKKEMGDAPNDISEIDEPSRTGRTYWKNQSDFFVYIKHWPTKVWHYGVIQHELFHVVDQCLRGKGITLSDHSDEAYAYLTEALTRDVYMKL